MNNKNLSILALILSILFLIPGANIAELIIGIIAMLRIKKSGNKEGFGFALASIVLSAALLLFFWIPFTLGFVVGVLRAI